MEERALKLLALRDVEGYGNKKILDLVSSFGSIDRVFSNAVHNGLIDKNNLTEYEKTLNECSARDIKVITFFDPEYPINLKRIGTPPLVLFAKGNIDLLKMPAISIVGTRQASSKSLGWAYNSAKELSNLGYVIVSGGALGTDTAAHKGSLENGGKTICVLGSGIENIYPQENKELIEEISRKGLVISENMPDRNVNRIYLLERNRITSGIGNKIVIVATGITGGTMAQYKVAVSQKKEIYCPQISLKLEPTEGIKTIIDNNSKVIVIRDIKELLDCSHAGQCESQKFLESFV
jgi:DNA processing protein